MSYDDTEGGSKSRRVLIFSTSPSEALSMFRVTSEFFIDVGVSCFWMGAGTIFRTDGDAVITMAEVLTIAVDDVGNGNPISSYTFFFIDVRR